MTHGRGAWNNSGAGGTKAFNNAAKPGPYYYIGSGGLDPKASQDNWAVHQAVKAYQRALNRRLGPRWEVEPDGIFGADTSHAVERFQNKHHEELTVWGGIGPDTSRLLLLPDLNRISSLKASAALSPTVISGLIRHESNWDVGAVGYVDNDDLGLAQINGRAHPDLSRAKRVRPMVAFNFVIDYMNNAIRNFDGVVRDAIASYNLGSGGARDWISQGRPEWYTPKGQTKARNVWAYIDSVLKG